jgi:hypothetical protein
LLSGHTPPRNHLHLLYVGAEVLKLLLLLTTGVMAYRVFDAKARLRPRVLQVA